jgi:hypothetical protein
MPGQAFELHCMRILPDCWMRRNPCTSRSPPTANLKDVYPSPDMRFLTALDESSKFAVYEPAVTFSRASAFNLFAADRRCAGYVPVDDSILAWIGLRSAEARMLSASPATNGQVSGSAAASGLKIEGDMVIVSARRSDQCVLCSHQTTQINHCHLRRRRSSTLQKITTHQPGTTSMGKKNQSVQGAGMKR